MPPAADLKKIVRLGDVAEQWGITRRCARRRLQRLDKSNRAKNVYGNGEGILVQFTPGGPLYVDLAMLKRYLPGVLDANREDVMVAMMNQLAALNARVDKLSQILAGAAWED